MAWDRDGLWFRSASVAGYLALAVALTWPLAKSPLRNLPMGTEVVVSVPALNAWTVWWNADRAQYAFIDYWHAPIFYPARYAFAFSEAQPTTLVVAPLVAASGPELAYNVYLLGTLTLNGVVAFRLLRRVGLAAVPAFFGGVLTEMLPIVHWQLGVLQLTTIWGVLWVIDRLVALRDGSSRQPLPPDPPIPPSPDPLPARPVRLRDGVYLGIAAAVCYAACNYFGLFLSVLLPLSLLPLAWGRLRDWRFWLSLAAAGLLAAVLSSPILWAQVVAKREYDWKREESLLYNLSARPRDYLNPHRLNPYLRPALDLKALQDPQRPLWTLGPGPVKIGLAAVGLVAGLAIRGRRRWTLFLVLLGGWAFLLSLGPALEIADWVTPRFRAAAEEPVSGWLPYRLLTKSHPGLALARSPFRYAFFVQIAIALLATNALDALWMGIRKVAQNWRQRTRAAAVTAGSLFVLAVAGLSTAEVVPKPQRLYELPALDQAWITWLRENTDPATPIVCLPFPMGASVEDYEATALFMIEQIGHRRPMVDGYSGFFPEAFVELKMLLSEFPDEVVIDELRRRRVGHIISADPEWTALASETSSLHLAFRDEDAKVSVFQVLPAVDDDGRATSP
jgi:hypothetical protein